MKEFEIFLVLVLYNFELKQKFSSHNSQISIGSHLKNYDFNVFMRVDKMCITVKNNLHNWIVLVEQN